VGEPSGLAYTTTATVLDRLFLKGVVSRKRVGRMLVYRPKIERETIERDRATQSLRQLLGADPQPAIAALVEAVDEIDPELLDELARAIKAHRRGRRGS
jgi:predicted transcriptional regulator